MPPKIKAEPITTRYHAKRGGKAENVFRCKYETFEDLVSRLGCVQKGRKEFDRHFSAGLWEEHAGVIFVLVDAEMLVQP